LQYEIDTQPFPDSLSCNRELETNRLQATRTNKGLYDGQRFTQLSMGRDERKVLKLDYGNVQKDLTQDHSTFDSLYQGYGSVIGQTRCFPTSFALHLMHLKHERQGALL
jgi:hypothetical protein